MRVKNHSVKDLPVVSVIIPWRIHDPSLKSLVKSIEKNNYPKNKIEIVIIENNSYIKNVSTTITMKKVHVDSEIGYTEAINLGCRSAKGKYILILNPDTYCDKNLIQEFVLFNERNTHVGVVGPVVYNLKNKNEISLADAPGIGFSPSFSRLKKVDGKSLKKITGPLQVNWVSGCCMFFAKDVWKKAKGFDNKYFIYWEDADFGMRLNRLHYNNYILPKGRIWHAVSAGVGVKNPVKVYYIVRNSILFYQSYSNITGKICLHSRTLVVFVVKLLKLLFDNKNIEDKAFITGILGFYKSERGKTKAL